MSFTQDDSTSTQGMTLGQGTQTLLGSNITPPPINTPQGKKPKAKPTTASFLGADAMPSSTVGRTTLMGAA